MIEEKTSDLSEICKNLHMEEPGRCPICGGIPTIKTSWDCMGWKFTWLECRCGLKFPFSGTFKEVAEKWRKITSEKEFEPSKKPFYVGIQSVCATCGLSSKCIEAKKMTERQKNERRCKDWLEFPCEKGEKEEDV